ncbi:hypothetical protein CDL15_Pgr021997 [Punica granatum]|nr:hypothetical protein CDL15_Pgr021997 [Punica granatum]
MHACKRDVRGARVHRAGAVTGAGVHAEVIVRACGCAKRERARQAGMRNISERLGARAATSATIHSRAQSEPEMTKWT